VIHAYNSSYLEHLAVENQGSRSAQGKKSLQDPISMENAGCSDFHLSSQL
jgi:hypothetical protein